MTAVALPADGPIPVNGKPIRARALQQRLHSVIYAVLIALIPAGIYFGTFEVHWFIHIGRLYWAGFDNKEWWDVKVGQWFSQRIWFITNTNWPDYRHSVFRNLLEPTLAFTAIGSLNAKPKYWNTKVGPARIALTIPAYLATYLVLASGGTWLILYNDAHGWHPANASRGAWDVLQFLILGLGIALVLHIIFGPVGARAQGAWTERVTDNWWRHGGKYQVPFLARHAVVAPTIRERIQLIVNEDMASGEGPRLIEKGVTKRSRAGFWVLVVLFTLAVIWLAFLGFIGHIWDGVFHLKFPYLAP